MNDDKNVTMREAEEQKIVRGVSSPSQSDAANVPSSSSASQSVLPTMTKLSSITPVDHEDPQLETPLLSYRPLSDAMVEESDPSARHYHRQIKLPPPEENPWRNASYILTTMQLMFTLLDMFMESGDVPAIHYIITTFQFVPALVLMTYQAIRVRGLWKYRADQSASLKVDLHIRRPFILLVIAMLFQLYVLVISGMWFDISFNVDSHWFEWSVFAVVLLFSLVNPATFSSVAKVTEEVKEAVSGTKKEKQMGLGEAVVSIFRKHFMREKLLFFLAVLVSCGKAIFSTYQGAIISELTKLVTKKKLDLETGELVIAADLRDVELQSALLVGVWALATIFGLMFDTLSALMLVRLEVWLRGEVFRKAIVYSRNQKYTDGSVVDPAATFGACYASDVHGVVSLYSTLLHSVIVNALLIVTNFIFLVMYNWEVAVATLCFLAMGVTSGPTDLAGDAARSAQRNETEGLSMLGDGVRTADGLETTAESLCEKHDEEVMRPMKKSLFAATFYANAAHAYISFFSSFLTVIIVITMAMSVYDGEMDSSDFLGVFFVFKQLQKPAMKMSGVLKKLIKNSAHLERLNKTVFGAEEEEIGGGSDRGRGDTAIMG